MRIKNAAAVGDPVAARTRTLPETAYGDVALARAVVVYRIGNAIRFTA